MQNIQNTGKKLPFLTLVLMISFASVNATLFTPALPAITSYFVITANMASHTIMWFLVGYALGQLVYGPFANRYGRKPALYIGISLQIISSFLCVLSEPLHSFNLLILGRFLLALGSGVGLKMVFTMVNECYSSEKANSIVTYLMLSFAITPGLGVAIGGLLTSYFNWTSCFYAGAIYGVLLLVLVTRLPETLQNVDQHAFRIKHLISAYVAQFKNLPLVRSGFLIGFSSCFIYIFAALAPFIAMNLFFLTSSEYGVANLLPLIGMVVGTLLSAQFNKKFSMSFNIRFGILFTGLGSVLMLVMMLLHATVIISLFLPTMLIYFGLCFVFSNVSTLAMQNVVDKAHGAAVMSFLNIGTATLAVMLLSFIKIKMLILPLAFIAFSILMMLLQRLNFSKYLFFNFRFANPQNRRST